MGREIMFRAWDTEDKRMYLNAQNAYDYGHGGPMLMTESFGALLQDDRYIVEQYTGLKDVNGVAVYEGDILDLHANGQEPVIYDGGRFICHQNGCSTLLWLCLNMQMGEVIGNIHEGVKEDAVQE